uniref:Protein kinase domain-containing protein n=1 Tax=Plectus sambesii TaxID=2011161 RepID=A0A914W1K8_9BILA
MSLEYGKFSFIKKKEEEDCVNPSEKLLNDKDEYTNSDALKQQGVDYRVIGTKLEIEPNTLTIIEFIGKGYFSDVHMGMLSLPAGKVPVAVKKSQMDTGSMNAVESAATLERQRQALKDELSIFAHLQSSSTGGHENVLKLLGAITTIRTDFCLLTEYCECGSMDRFLQEKWKNGDFEDELVFDTNVNKKVWKIQRDSDWGDNYQSRRENGTITTSDLLWFALQIARAMQFLAAMNVIHRDIAVRNVLLKLDFTLKVADFGLSRKLKENDNAYYIGKEGTALPMRYIAPETLKSGRFSITSEYWSFGVVVWELFTFAEKQPYSVEYDSRENNGQFYEFLAAHLSSGHRLSIPHNVPQQIKTLLSRLWHTDPKKRPSFEICRKVIRQELMQSCPNAHWNCLNWPKSIGPALKKEMLKPNFNLGYCIEKGKVYLYQMKKLLNGTERLQIKGLQKHRTGWETCISMVEVCLSQMKKQLSGTEKPQNKELQMRSLILDGCLIMDVACLNQMMKQLNGTEKRLHKEMQMQKIGWETCIMMAEPCLNQMQKLSNGTEKQQNKKMHMAKRILDGCMNMDVALTNQMKKPSYGTEKLQSEKMQKLKIILDRCIEKGKALISQMKKLLNGTERLQIKDLQKHRTRWETCISMVEVCLSQMMKLLNGTEKQQNKDMQMRSLILDGCIIMDVACLNQMKKLSNGTEKRLPKEMQMQKIGWETCIMMAEPCLSQMQKPSNGTEKQQNKEMHMAKRILDGCMNMDMALTSQMKKLPYGTKKLQSKIMRKRKLTLDRCIKMDEACRNQTMKLPNGSEKSQNKEIELIKSQHNLMLTYDNTLSIF